MAGFSQIFEIVDKITAPMKKIQQAYNNSAKATEQAKRTTEKYTMANKLADISTLNYYKKLGKTGQELRDLAKELGIVIPKLYDVGNAAEKTGGAFGGMFSAFTLSSLAMRGIDLIKNGVMGLFTLASGQTKQKNLLYSMVGDEQTANALFAHINNVAQNSTASVGQLTSAYQTFMSTTKNVSSLDKLANITERLAMFDTTGQGFDGATFSVKELASGDYTSIAERFNISRSKIQEMGIHELFKKGDIEGGIAQFEVLLDQMGYTQEAAEKMSKDPSVLWGQFTSNVQTKFASAMDSVMAKIVPLIERMKELTNTAEFDRFVNSIVNSVSFAVGVLASIFDFIVSNWDVMSKVFSISAIAIGSFISVLGVAKGAVLAYKVVSIIAATAAYASAVAEMFKTGATWASVAAQNGLNKALYACPLVWIIALILAVIGVLIYWSELTGVLMGLIFIFGAYVINIFISIINVFLTAAEFFANVWKDPMYAVKKLFVDLWNQMVDFFIAPFMGAIGSVGDALGDAFVSGVNIAIAAVNWLIGLVNKIPGVDLGDGLSAFAKGDKSFAQSGWDMAQSWKAEAPTTDADVWSAPKMDYMDYGNAWDTGYNMGYNGSHAIKDAIGGMFGLGGPDPTLMDINSQMGELPENLPGAISNPAYTEEVNISEESIKLMRDVANMRFTQNFVTVTPDVKFGDVTVNETADYKKFADGLVEELEEGLQTAASGVYA
jgi:hypothetical protein